MSTIVLTKDTFEDTVTRPGITLVDWWAAAKLTQQEAAGAPR